MDDMFQDYGVKTLEGDILQFLLENPTVDVRINASSLPYDVVGRQSFRVRITMTETCTDERRGYITYEGTKQLSRWYLSSDILSVGFYEILEEMKNGLR